MAEETKHKGSTNMRQKASWLMRVNVREILDYKPPKLEVAESVR